MGVIEGTAQMFEGEAQLFCKSIHDIDQVN